MNWVNFVHDANLKPDHNIFQSWIFPYYTTGIGPNEIPVNLPEDNLSIYSHTRLINEGYDVLNSPPVGLSNPMTALSKKFELHQNCPNPFSLSTVIGYQLQESGKVMLKVYNIQGMEVRTLVNKNQAAGKHSVVWDGKNDSGKNVGTGIYFYQLHIDDKSISTKKMILNKASFIIYQN